ncbi:uncharacterized protein SAPINGB_P005183 [Magnusiomyces paraingens]|uniref:Type 1 phosphatases regulator n=1 Tax=Magnusiomyces paraingens TaxID=2606893 RepID=A0A5E8BYW5_9ASCO|nr:uncharacterized protein SAPINGB_P005183 [Saprochaete ingens]VVT56624.1 unnamed protein product [Saprochaete ingens]
MPPRSVLNSATPSTSSTVVATPEPEEQNGTLHLQAPENSTESAPRSRSSRGVRWTEEVVDNEHMNKKKSKICCIFHKQRQFGESSSESDSSSSDDDSDSDTEGAGGPLNGIPDFSSKKPGDNEHDHDEQQCNHNHEHDHHHDHHHKRVPRKLTEKLPKDTESSESEPDEEEEEEASASETEADVVARRKMTNEEREARRKAKLERLLAKGKLRRNPSPNAYERQPAYNTVEN